MKPPMLVYCADWSSDMSFIKWLRKNNTKIMAIVVIVLMIVFIGGTALEQLLQGFTTRHNKTAAYYGEGQRITDNDLAQAEQELEILQMIDAPLMLRAYPAAGPFMKLPALYTLFLSELIFEEKGEASQVSSYVKQLATTQGYSISEKQINEIYKRTLPGRVYWLLLKEEAHRAGMRFSSDHARFFLREVARSFFRTTYSQMMESLISPAAGRSGIKVTEPQVLSAFADLMSVWEYAYLICSNEDVTEQQVKHNISLTRETMDIECVRFDSLVFSKDTGQPGAEQINEQLEKYKDVLPDEISDINSCGFGYKLPDRVAFAYLGVKIEDIEKIINKPTQEDAEKFYQQRRESLKQKVNSDPNDPNSPLIEQTLTFPEVADMISEKLLQDRLNAKTNEILQKAKNLTELPISEEEKGIAVSPQMTEKAVERYNSAAEKLSREYNIKIYAGKTGLLSAQATQKDPVLRELYLEGVGFNPVTNPLIIPLVKIAFSIEQIGKSELSQFDMRKVKIYENIGPLKDMLGKTMLIIQIVDAQKESVPKDINAGYSIETTSFEDSNNVQEKKYFSVKEKVIEDLKKLAAMETTEKKAREFVKLAVENGWDKAIDEYNKLYPKSSADNNEPNSFQMQELFNLPRAGELDIQTLIIQAEGDLVIEQAVPAIEKERFLKQKLYSLIPQDSNSLGNVPYVLEFKPDMSYYCIKKLTVKRINEDQYQMYKPMQAFRDEVTRIQSAAAVFYNPENIVTRMNFRWSETRQPVKDTNDVKTNARPEAKT
jgi:hypothetical protein